MSVAQLSALMAAGKTWSCSQLLGMILCGLRYVHCVLNPKQRKAPLHHSAPLCAFTEYATKQSDCSVAAANSCGVACARAVEAEWLVGEWHAEWLVTSAPQDFTVIQHVILPTSSHVPRGAPPTLRSSNSQTYIVRRRNVLIWSLLSRLMLQMPQSLFGARRLLGRHQYQWRWTS